MSTPTFTLRRPTVIDAMSLAEHANDEQVFAGLRDSFPHPYSVDDGLRFIDTVLADTSDSAHWVIDLNGEAVGVMSLFPGKDVYRTNAEIGYWIGRAFWGKGIMTAAIRQTTDYAFRKRNLNRVYAEVFGQNIGSIRALEKCGFEREFTLPNVVVKNGRVQDMVCLGMRASNLASI